MSEQLRRESNITHRLFELAEHLGCLFAEAKTNGEFAEQLIFFIRLRAEYLAELHAEVIRLAGDHVTDDELLRYEVEFRPRELLVDDSDADSEE